MVFMHRRGIFTFVLVLLFIQSAAVMSGIAAEQQRSISDARSLALQMERARLVREEVEVAVDRTIGQTMLAEISSGNKNPAAIRAKIAENLVSVFGQFEDAYPENPKVDFFAGNYYGGGYLRLLGTEGGKPKARELENYFRVLVLHAGSKAYAAEFTYTGGEMKSRVLYAKISTESFSQVFVIPIGYKIAINGVVP
ncbi:MAG: hypothetical protein V1676_01720 [Candidatus Diapherotrites archaeon]